MDNVRERNESMDPIRVVIADDDDAILRTLSDLIFTDASLELVGVAHDTSEVIALALAESPDVALVDVRMPGGGGAKAAREIRELSSSIRVVAFSNDQDAEVVLEMFRAGAFGYVAKDGSIDDVLRAIHRAAEGRTTISTGSLGDVAERLAEFHLHRQTDAVRESTERIERAIGTDVLQMVFQPIVESSSLRIVGLEALARFATEPRRPPDAWFAEASRVGLLTELELVAVRHALSPLDHLPQGVYLSVNVSPGTLASGSLLDLLGGAVTERVVVEMTEQSPVEGYDELNARLRPLREMGVRFAIDDVGAGYASLRHVVAMTPDLMKVDRTLVTNIDSDHMRRTLMGRLVSFANEVGVGVVAEGVETESELETLRELGVPYAQGFYLGRPGQIPLGVGDRPLVWPSRHGFRTEEPRPAKNGVLDQTSSLGRTRTRTVGTR
jgi:EAL domain-containing protein (putative c-di-GMP-specific phosphodiesterase class I)/DNA-binding NarL/FixJ family response regulator